MSWDSAIKWIMLVSGAFHPAVRKTALVVSGASKAVFVALVLAQGGRFLSYQAGIAVAVDTVWVLVFAAYLWSSRPRRAIP